MAKKTTELALSTPQANATVALDFGAQDYEIASVHIGRYYGMLRHHGTALILTRLMIAVPLAVIRAHDLKAKAEGRPAKALQNFYTLAERGTVNVPKMSKRTLSRCLEVFDAYCAAKKIKKAEVLALPGIVELKGEQLELWADTPPENGSPLMRDMLAWARTQGLTLAENETLAAISTPPPAGGGDNPEPSDPTQLAEQEAAEFLERMIAHFETDLHAQLPTGDYLNHEDKKLADHPCTWSLLPAKDLTRLHKVVERWQASTTRLIKLKAKR